MRFTLIDRITELEPGHRITAVKTVSMAEEYLADHFPGFPVLPGVLMLEAMVQAGAWLIRVGEDFAHSTVLLKEARTVKYASFVEPGKQLVVSANIVNHGPRETKLQGSGVVDGVTTVSAKLTLERRNLRELNPDLARVDEFLVVRLRELLSILWNGPIAPAPA